MTGIEEVPGEPIRSRWSGAVLPRLKDTGWVFVTADTRITTRPVEAAALKESDVTALFLGPFWAKLTLWPQVAWLVKWTTRD